MNLFVTFKWYYGILFNSKLENCINNNKNNNDDDHHNNNFEQGSQCHLKVVYRRLPVEGKCATAWTLANLYPSSRSIWNLKVLVFAEGGKLDNLEKTLRARREPTTNSTHKYGNQSRVTKVRGERLSTVPTMLQPFILYSMINCFTKYNLLEKVLEHSTSEH